MATLTLSGTTYELDAEQARNGVGAVSAALGALAVLAPVRTAGAFGVSSSGAALPLLVRMVGVRNAAMGLRTLQATGDEQARAVQAGLAVGAVDAVALLVAARKGLLSKKAAVGTLVVVGAIAAAGAVASSTG